jgi:molybdopterin synthase sulfur carrier subunit
MKILFFAQCAQWMRTREMAIQLQRPTRLLEAMRVIPELAPLLDRRLYLKVAVNQVLADYTREVHDGDEVAFFPPFSGG